MKTLLIGAAIAGLVAVPIARAGEHASTTATTDKTTTTEKTTSQPSSSTSSQVGASSQTGVTASASKDLSGTVKKVDQDKRSLKISSPTGGEQDVKIAQDAKFMNADGSQCSLSQIKEGDQVRASFDSSGDQASRIEVTPKNAKADEKSKTNALPAQK